MDSAAYRTEKGKMEALLMSTLNKNITLKQGTQIGLFQVCTSPIKIVNDDQKAEN